MQMKLVAAVASIAALGLVACGGTTAETPAETPAEAPADPPSSDEAPKN